MNFETPPAAEHHERKASVIRLDFFRHSIKEKSDTSAAGDNSIPLSEAGRELAKERAFSDANLGQAIAFGSERIRAQETAAIRMSGESRENLDTLREYLDEGAGYGSKIGIDERLDYRDTSSTPVGAANEAASAQGEYVHHIVHESDRIAAETGDNSGAHYSYKAAQIASVIEKYLEVSDRWNQLVNDPTKHYTPQLERYFSSHQGTLESFLAKVLELSGETEKFDAFMAENKQGFDYLQGFRVEITEDPDGEKNITLLFALNNEPQELTVSQDMISEIAAGK